MNRAFRYFYMVILFLVIPFSVVFSSGPPYRKALPGYTFQFPKDHGAHPEFQTEWWYYTGHLFNEQKRKFGFELTFFRFGNPDPEQFKNPSRWAAREIYLAHFAISDLPQKEFFYTDKISREALGKAGAKSEKLSVWIDQWRVEEVDGVHRLRASDEGRAINLQLSPSKPPVIHGYEGISRKGGNVGEASHYYSMTRMTVDGTLRMGDKIFPVKGLAWMDHEFSTQSMAQDLVGWDWFSLQLENQWEIMLYLLRLNDGTFSPFSSGTLIDPAGRPVPLQAIDFSVENLAYWKSPKSQGTYPIRWNIKIPRKNVDIKVTPDFENQELLTPESTQVTYWEGAVQVQGTWEGKEISGMGYTEMTGYSKPLTGPE